MFKSLIANLAGRCGYRIIHDRDHVAQIDLFDLLVRRLAAQMPDFFFVQIGANDGVMDDPLHGYISEFHWRGILVEPVPFYFEKLKANYAGEGQLIFENCAIAQRDGTTRLYVIPPAPDLPDWVHGTASFRRENVMQYRRDVPNLAARIQEVEVPSMSVASLLARHGVTRIDLLQIDVQGFDYEILKMVDFSRLKPRLIQFEDAMLPLATQRECYAFLNGHGYQLTTVGINTIALLDEGKA